MGAAEDTKRTQAVAILLLLIDGLASLAKDETVVNTEVLHLRRQLGSLREQTAHVREELDRLVASRLATESAAPREELGHRDGLRDRVDDVRGLAGMLEHDVTLLEVSRRMVGENDDGDVVRRHVGLHAPRERDAVDAPAGGFTDDDGVEAS